jgi:hypothetical protein
MKPEYLAEIAEASLRLNGVELLPHQRRELGRVIASREANRERFIQKLRSPTYEWKKPSLRR